ncbi:diguanylate cyclase domain-containing protein, partial [Aeromonas rivipollensis]|uniref:diguanylate cyclase domain-containing protein n=6 Tax=Aeromonadaceae TaxID=84642 RepID=UPI001F33DC35
SLHQAHNELLKLALHDSLTRLPNRLLFADRLEQRIQECQHSQRSFSLLFLDLDGFKIINDAYGHHTGDLLLVEVAERITTLLGPNDTASRFGGDEFVLALAPG